MNKKALVVFCIILFIVVTVGAIVIFSVDRENNIFPDETEVIDTEPTTTIVVKPIQGDTSLSEEREALLDSNIVSVIEQSSKPIPVVDEQGNYVIDENGNLVYEGTELPDYTNVKDNLAVIINAFADAGYPESVIQYVQRFYFRYYKQLDEYGTDELIGKLMSCFSPTENTKSELTRKISSAFGFYRDDEFAFLFEEPLSSAEIKVLFFDVKPIVDFQWTRQLENHCIYSEWFAQNNDEVHERNLEDYLHIIVYRMKEKSASPFDVRLAQLIYCAFIADIEYRSDGIDSLIDAVIDCSQSFDELKMCLLDRFGVDISANQIIPAYYKGITEFNEGGEG